jgi:hypothetical protein
MANNGNELKLLAEKTEVKKTYEDMAAGSVRVLLTKMTHGSPAMENIARSYMAHQISELSRAMAIIDETHARMKVAAAARKSSVYAMDNLLKNRDYYELNEKVPPMEIKPEWLIGAAKIVYEYFKTIGKNPVIDDYPHVIRVSCNL